MQSMANTNRRRSQSNPSSSQAAAAAAIANHFDVARTSKQGFDSDNHRLTGADTDEPTTAVSGHAGAMQSTHMPHWQREIANSRVGRHSRASSIMSTRTRLTHQSDDARSVEFEAGGQSFRISRDGSRVTNVGAPPPYPGPPLEGLVEESDEEELPVEARRSDDTVREPSPDSDLQAESGETDLPVRTHSPPGNLHNEALPNPNRLPGVLELPQRLKSVLGLRWYGSSTSDSEGSDANVARTIGALRRTQSDSSSLQNFSTSLIGLSGGNEPSSDAPILDAERAMQGIRWTEAFFGTNRGDEQAAEVSHNYTRMMRDIDHENRKRLHERDNELARMRELLDEKDKVYRQQLRERDYTIDALHEQARFKDQMINDLKTQKYEMEEDVLPRLEKARNEVESMWETRWREYEKLLMETLGSRASRNPIEHHDERQRQSAVTEAPSAQGHQHTQESHAQQEAS